VAGQADDYYVRRWQDFQRLERIRSHWWWRPGWALGRSLYTWYLTFEDAVEVHRLAAACQQWIALPTLDPVAPDGLHMTLQPIGFTDEVPAPDIDAIADTAAVLCASLAPFELTLAPVDADRETVLLRVRPWEPVQRLRLALREAIAAVRGPERVPGPVEGFAPHVTLCYCNAEADAAPLRTLLRSLPDTGPVSTTVRAASLVRLNRDENVYRWTAVARVALTG
jgi:2'-5' RNA ligase